MTQFIRHVVTCWICGKVIGSGNSPTGDCGSQDQRHRDARNPPKK